MERSENESSRKHSALLTILLQEYEKLKDEQIARIGFRDNLIYVTLGVFGAILSFSLVDPEHYFALLVLPWTSFILGWTYLVNDEKISSLGRHIRNVLRLQLEEMTGGSIELLGWERAHRNDKHRLRRKFEQLAIDILTFVGPGIAAICAFLVLAKEQSKELWLLLLLESGCLLLLLFEIYVYADMKRSPNIEAIEATIASEPSETNT
ncbi:hypothetical protein [Gimesia fumaroli]|uniref:Integral membrane protein n=1 Tax=Gimesia fumaroli TaxID=2527976 RepID=A0A518I5X7_9PLAN|nr:hypothetical protein [Gimesia fumaroli]QDV48465.1 hypothetical protein Enr17x_04770 [Gimesia fumaroli]